MGKFIIGLLEKLSKINVELLQSENSHLQGENVKLATLLRETSQQLSGTEKKVEYLQSKCDELDPEKQKEEIEQLKEKIFGEKEKELDEKLHALEYREKLLKEKETELQQNCKQQEMALQEAERRLQELQLQLAEMKLNRDKSQAEGPTPIVAEIAVTANSSDDHNDDALPQQMESGSPNTPGDTTTTSAVWVATGNQEPVQTPDETEELAKSIIVNEEAVPDNIVTGAEDPSMTEGPEENTAGTIESMDFSETDDTDTPFEINDFTPPSTNNTFSAPSEEEEAKEKNQIEDIPTEAFEFNIIPDDQIETEHPQEVSTDNATEQDATEEHPQEESTDNATEQDATEEHPQEESIDNATEQDATEEHPQEVSTDNATEQDATEEHPQEESIDNATEQDTTEEHPQEESIDNSTEQDTTEEEEATELLTIDSFNEMKSRYPYIRVTVDTYTQKIFDSSEVEVIVGLFEKGLNGRELITDKTIYVDENRILNLEGLSTPFTDEEIQCDFSNEDTSEQAAQILLTAICTGQPLYATYDEKNGHITERNMYYICFKPQEKRFTLPYKDLFTDLFNEEQELNTDYIAAMTQKQSEPKIFSVSHILTLRPYNAFVSTPQGIKDIKKGIKIARKNDQKEFAKLIKAEIMKKVPMMPQKVLGR